MLRISMWLGLLAVTTAVSLSGPLSGLNDQLAADSEADAKATEEVKCWCKDVQSALTDRLRNAGSETSQLERVRDARFYENVGLNVEVKRHKKQIDESSQSLQAAAAIAERSREEHVSEKEETSTALQSLRKAMDIVPKGHQIHGVLTGLEDSFASKLEAAQEEHKTRQAQFEDVNAAKAEMIRLAKHSANTKMRRLADGKVVIAQAKSDIAAYAGQQEADWALQATLRSMCGDIAEATTKREKQRQDIMIAISEQKANNAQNVALKAMQKVMLLKSKSVVKAGCSNMLQTLGGAFKGDCDAARERAEDTKKRADENLAGAKKAASDIMKLMDKSGSIQAGVSKVLSNAVLRSHLATSKGGLESGIKAKVSTFGDTADADLKATPSFFDEVRAKAQASTRADMKVVTSFQMGAATAGEAVVEAGKCK